MSEQKKDTEKNWENEREEAELSAEIAQKNARAGEGRATRLGTESIGKLLFRLSVPTIAAQIVNALYNIVDRMYIGHMRDIGNDALTAMGVCLSIIMIISAFAALTAMGGAAPRVDHAGAGAERRSGAHPRQLYDRHLRGCNRADADLYDLCGKIFMVVWGDGGIHRLRCGLYAHLRARNYFRRTRFGA